MNQNINELKTPAIEQAMKVKSNFDLTNHGLTNLKRVYWNLPAEALREEAIFRGEGQLSARGSLAVNTGKITNLSPNDKFIVKESTNENNIWWGQYNRPFANGAFNSLYQRLLGFLQGRDVFVQDVRCGSSPHYELPIRIISEYAWHSLFARIMFPNIKTDDELRSFIPEFTVLIIPSFQAVPEIDNTTSSTAIMINFEQRLCTISGTAYSGEIKKAIFTVMNYLLPHEGILPLHSSAYAGTKRDIALFLGETGSGKTSLSTDNKRPLLCDDELGWSNGGVFGFENGCFARTINLSQESDPEIFTCAQSHGTILENVSLEPASLIPDFSDSKKTTNAHAIYPIRISEKANDDKIMDHPKHIFMLLCDPTGTLPALAKLTTQQAVYQFISGFMSKLPGIDIPQGKDPIISFSPCFGAHFMAHNPNRYAEMLRKKIDRYNVTCWLVNTGWHGGSFGTGKRISIHDTRHLIHAVIDGKLTKGQYSTDPVFGFEIPKTCDGISEKLLDPINSWANPLEFQQKYLELASLFIENFKKYTDGCQRDVIEAGPSKKVFLK